MGNLKVAIVGSSKLTPQEQKQATAMILSILKSELSGSRLKGDLTIITGDADGVDALVRIECTNLAIPLIVEKAPRKRWNGSNGYRDRNVRIGKKAELIYTIATKVKDTNCFHCVDDVNARSHQRTGGCWTRRNAMDNLNKKGFLYII